MIKGSTLTVGNVNAMFVNASLDDVLIQSNFTDNRGKDPIQLEFSQSTLTCSSNTACGLIISQDIPLKFTLLKSKLRQFEVNLDVKETLVIMNDTELTQPNINI